MLWTGLSIAREDDGKISFLSLGMQQLNLPDLLLVVGPETEDDAFEMFFNLTAFIAEHGQPFDEGDSVGRTEDEHIPVRYVPSPIDSPDKVWRVEYP